MRILAGDSTRAVLERSRDQRELERVGLTLARSDATQDLALLAEFLTRTEFLARLDSVDDPQIKTLRFARLLAAIGRNSADGANHLLRSLLSAPDVKTDSDRIDIILQEAVMVRPLPEERAQLFRDMDPRVYTLLGINLLIGNGSPRALEEAKRQIQSKPREVPDPSVVSVMHRSLMPRRTDPALIRMAQQLIAASISNVLKVGVMESFFDYQYEPWFGPIKNPPVPPKWEDASPEARAELVVLADLGKKIVVLPPELRSTVEKAVQDILAVRTPSE